MRHFVELNFFFQGVWMSILGLIGVVVIILKLVTVADVHVLKYINLVRQTVKAVGGELLFLLIIFR